MLHEGSAISDEVIIARGYQTIIHPDDLRDLGFSKEQARTAPVLAIPLWDVHGQRTGWQIRPDSPRITKGGKVDRYETPKGGRVSLDVHPSVQPLLGNPAVPLWITEGVKKGDALVAQGVCAIALMGGVWGFRGTNEHGGKVILPAWEHVALNGRLVYVAYDSDLATKPNVKAALQALWRFLRDRQAIPARVHWPEEFQQQKWGIDDFLANGHTLEEVLAMIPPIGPLPMTPHRRRNGHANGSTIPPGDPPQDNTVATDDPAGALPYSDYTNALALVREHGQHLRYCYAWKSWLVWTGTHWQRDETGSVPQAAKRTIKRLARHAEDLDADTAVKALMAHVKTSLSKASLDAMVRTAQDEPGIPVKPEAFDLDPWVLNCTNGTLDLRTGTLRPHHQADLITKCLSIAYDPHAQCPTWERFLWRIMGGSQEDDHPDMGAGELENRRKADDRARALIGFLQRAIGYTLTGSTREQCLFILHGPTKTGKSTFLATLRALLGPYGQQADMDSFMHKDRQEVRNDLADLAGSRFVYALESQEGRRLAESLVKQLTGGVDLYKARFLFQEHFTFKPQFKIFLGTNHKPIIRDTDSAIWERIRLVPFTVQIPQPERDKTLDERLQTELPGVLAWAVRGCLDWQRMGELGEPDAVIEATAGYRSEMDALGRFLEECCLLSPDVRVKTGALYDAYKQWCVETGEQAMTLTTMGKELGNRGFARRPSGGTVWRLGLALPASDA
jgi:putative DNA primase/helicase